METTSEKRTHVFGVWNKQDFKSWKRFTKSPLMNWILFFSGCFLITLLLLFQLSSLPSDIQVNAFAPKDIKADQNYEIEDEESTREQREEAIRSVLTVYDYDEEMNYEVRQRIEEAFETARAHLAKHPQATREEVDALFEKASEVPLSEEEQAFLFRMKYRVDLEQVIRDLVYSSMLTPIVGDAAGIRRNADQGVAIRRVRAANPDENESMERNLTPIRSIDEVRSELEQRAKNLFKKELPKGFSLDLITSIASRFVRINLSENVAETAQRRDKAALNEKPVLIKIKAGESIVRSGDPYTKWHKVVLEGIHKQKNRTNLVVKVVGTFLFVALLVLVIYSFAARYIQKFRPTRLDLLFMGTNLLGILIFVRLMTALADAFRDSFPIGIEAQGLYLMIPVSAGAMLTRLILNSEAAIVFGLVASTLTGLFLKTEMDLSVFFLISSLAGAGAIAHADRRSAILNAGVFTGLVNMVAILAIKMIHVISVTQSWASWDLLTAFVAAFIGGTNSALYVLFYTPIVEAVFGYTTDIKLLELGNLNHPLMKDMIVKAPGTYHHSQLVAVLAEAAAESIGANSILARIGAYFHDIGKMVKPLYFIENQRGGENRHDRLAPSMSALIISSHVKDGMDLARTHKLPQVIVDMIPQHQGTKLITFFYNKAKERETDLQTVNEQDYRYPGPRPQTQEAGILLLADGVEAAVRSLPEKTHAKIEAMVQKIINKGFAEEQLDECDLTLKDLRTIADSFVRVLIGIYHHRIEYPDMEEKNAITLPIKKLEAVSSGGHFPS